MEPNIVNIFSKLKLKTTSFAASDSDIAVVDLLETSQLVPSPVLGIPSSLRKSVTLKVTDRSSGRVDRLECSKGENRKRCKPLHEG